MRFLVAPDKFKGSLSAREVAANIARGIRDVISDTEIDIAPVADGGEGTADALFQVGVGEWVSCSAHDALGRPLEARYLWRETAASAVIEMSEAAGMRRISPVDRNIVGSNTFGVGEMIISAMDRGAREIILGLGGSATNDGGSGFARSLGFQFFAGGDELTNGPEDLIRLTQIVPPRGRELPRILGAFDVRNPLLGERGTARVFAEQKGATTEQVELLDRALRNLADIAARDLGTDFREAVGAGAAGGLGYGLLTFCGATLRPGFDLVSFGTDLEARVASADIVITGEGKLDAQTREGKAPAGVSALARKHGKRVFAIVGVSDLNASELFERVFVLSESPGDQTAAIENAANLLRVRASELARVLVR